MNGGSGVSGVWRRSRRKRNQLLYRSSSIKKLHPYVLYSECVCIYVCMYCTPPYPDKEGQTAAKKAQHGFRTCLYRRARRSFLVSSIIYHHSLMIHHLFGCLTFPSGLRGVGVGPIWQLGTWEGSAAAVQCALRGRPITRLLR